MRSSLAARGPPGVGGRDAAGPARGAAWRNAYVTWRIYDINFNTPDINQHYVYEIFGFRYKDRAARAQNKGDARRSAPTGVPM